MFTCMGRSKKKKRDIDPNSIEYRHRLAVENQAYCARAALRAGAYDSKIRKMSPEEQVAYSAQFQAQARAQAAPVQYYPQVEEVPTPRPPLEYGDVYQQVAQQAAMNDRLDQIENNGWGASANIVDNTNALNNAYSQDYSLYAAQQQYNDIKNAPIYSGFDAVTDVANGYSSSAVERILKQYE